MASQRPFSLTNGVLAIFLLLASGLLRAEVALTSKLIEQWIAASPELQAFGEKHEAEIEAHEPPQEQMMQDFASNFTVERMLQPLKASGLYDEAEDLVEKYGFDGLEEWAGTTAQIAKAYFALESGAEMKAMEPQMKAQMEAMMNDPNMTPEMKAMMQQGMAASQGMMKMMDDVPESDKTAVKPYLPQIRKLFEDMGDEK